MHKISREKDEDARQVARDIAKAKHYAISIRLRKRAEMLFEHLMFLGSVLIHFVVAAHPLHILFNLQYYALTAATTHSGFEGMLVKGKNRLKLGTFHHQMHHRYFECNYGSLKIAEVQTKYSEFTLRPHCGTWRGSQRISAIRPLTRFIAGLKHSESQSILYLAVCRDPQSSYQSA